MTEAATQDYTDLNSLDLAGVDFDSLGAYEEAQTFTPIAPGRYPVALPPAITGKVIEVGGRNALEFDLEGLRIADDAAAFGGRPIFNQRVTTLPIKAKGKTLNATDAWDLLLNFGLASKEAEPTPQEYIEGMKAIAGLTTPNPVEITMKGSYQDPGNDKANTRGYVNVYEKAFKVNGVAQASITVTKTDGTTVEVKAKPTVAWRGWSGRA